MVNAVNDETEEDDLDTMDKFDRTKVMEANCRMKCSLTTDSDVQRRNGM